MESPTLWLGSKLPRNDWIGNQIKTYITDWV